MTTRTRLQVGDHVMVTRQNADAFGGSIGDHGIISHIVDDRYYIRFLRYTYCGRGGSIVGSEDIHEKGLLYVRDENLTFWEPPPYVIKEMTW